MKGIFHVDRITFEEIVDGYPMWRSGPMERRPSTSQQISDR